MKVVDGNPTFERDDILEIKGWDNLHGWLCTTDPSQAYPLWVGQKGLVSDFSDGLYNVTVTAFTWYRDDNALGRESLVLFSLNRPPHFLVCYYDHDSHTLLVLAHEYNIVNAVRVYEESGGDV